MTTGHKMLDELWDSAPKTTAWFDPKQLEGLPLEAARFLLHALAPGAPLPQAVHLRMHGQIRLDERWTDFEAEQVIHWERGFVWRARAKVKGLPVTGYDRLVDGEGEMRWKMLGLFPVMTASGPEIARSSAGRVAGEALWLPSVLLGEGVKFTAQDGHLAVDIEAHGETSHILLGLDGRGGVATFRYPRWGNPDKTGFHYESFGGIVEAEKTIDGITFPSKLRLGWYFSEADERPTTPDAPAEPTRFVTEGEFFRCEIDDLEFR